MHSKIEQEVQRFLLYLLPLPPNLHSLPTMSIAHRSGSIVTTDEPALTHHYPLKSVVYLRGHPWCLYILWVRTNASTIIVSYRDHVFLMSTFKELTSLVIS